MLKILFPLLSVRLEVRRQPIIVFSSPLFLLFKGNLCSALWKPCTDVTLRNLLYGDTTLTEEQNKRIFHAVHIFTQMSKRFDSQ